MDLLEQVAAMDPATPGGVLAMLTGRGPTLDGYLLAHPSTPEHVLPSFVTGPFFPDGALSSPAITPTTRQRLWDHTSTETLVQMDRLAPHFAEAVQVLAARLREGTDPALPDIAVALLDRADVDLELRVHALDVVLANLESAERALGVRTEDIILAAAVRHPAHLRTWAAACPPGGTLRAALSEYAALHEAGQDPHGMRVAQVLASLPDQLTDAVAHQILASVPDVKVAELVLARCPSNFIATQILHTRCLVGTPVWARAWALRVTGKLPSRGTRLPTQGPLIDLVVEPRWDEATRTSVLPLVVDQQRLDAVIGNLDELQLPHPTSEYDWSELAEHAARLRLHPATPASAYPLLHRTLANALTYLWDGYLPVGHFATILAGVGEDSDLGPVLASVPLPELIDGATDDSTAWDATCWHLMPVLRPVWADPDLCRAVLSLAPAFTGSITELVQTAASIAA